MVATTVGEDEETPPPQHHYQCPVVQCTVYAYALKYVYIQEIQLCFGKFAVVIL